MDKKILKLIVLMLVLFGNFVSCKRLKEKAQIKLILLKMLW